MNLQKLQDILDESAKKLGKGTNLGEAIARFEKEQEEKHQENIKIHIPKSKI